MNGRRRMTERVTRTEQGQNTKGMGVKKLEMSQLRTGRVRVLPVYSPGPTGDCYYRGERGPDGGRRVETVRTTGTKRMEPEKGQMDTRVIGKERIIMGPEPMIPNTNAESEIDLLLRKKWKKQKNGRPTG